MVQAIVSPEELFAETKGRDTEHACGQRFLGEAAK
jgi:hypothetical protein